MYRYVATESFWKSFYALPPEKKASTRAAWDIFKNDPFDARLRTHVIHRLTALRHNKVYSVSIEGNLRVVFEIINGDLITFGIGTHDIYQ
jgi:hypothetical protein